MIIAGRNQVGLSQREIEYCLEASEFLCEGKTKKFIITRASEHSSQTHFNEIDGKVYLGADVKPGTGIEANARMSRLACLAHELAHAERFELGFRRPTALPDVLVDEAETSLHASFMSSLTANDQTDLIEDARDRLNQWFVEKWKGVV
jgi:hypothetical protein